MVDTGALFAGALVATWALGAALLALAGRFGTFSSSFWPRVTLSLVRLFQLLICAIETWCRLAIDDSVSRLPTLT